MTALQAEFKAIRNETVEFEECEMDDCMDGAVTSSQQITENVLVNVVQSYCGMALLASVHMRFV